MATEHEKWRKFLQPLVTGLVTLMAIATLYLRRSDNDKTDSRLTALEIRADVTDKRSDKFGDCSDNVKMEGWSRNFIKRVHLRKSLFNAPA